MKRVHNRLQRDYPDVDFILDDAAHDIHKLTTPGDPDPQRVEDLYIVEKNGRRTLLTKDSAIIGKIPKRVRTVRIFADAKKDLLGEICNKARELEAQEV